jgi:hypothetical protein
MPDMLYILFALSILAFPLSKYLGTLRVFDTSKQEAVIADEWNKIKTRRSSR